MGIHIREGAEPLSEASLASRVDRLIQAPSEAARVLRQELERYCAGEVNGRSFLIAGHRGAGKTTMVSAAIDRVMRKARYDDDSALLHPLPVFLHGPSLFSPKGARIASNDLAEQAKEALVQVILGLHREAVNAFVRSYRDRAINDRSDAGDSRPWQDAYERAAQFEIEVLENPPATRLREFWEHAGRIDRGVLFHSPRAHDQGMRELVALNGLCNAHQRISGDLQAKDTVGREQKTEVPPSSLAQLRSIELVKPLAAIFAGTSVTAGGALGTQTLIGPALLGVLAAMLTSLLFESGGQTTEKRGRQLDTVFIPDLSLKTLDRVLPTLLQRLRDAGLAPVLVIDELDKVRGLPDRLEAMIHFLKKLVAEKVFTCFLTDRSYLEHLRINGRGAAYGMAYSYFSHPLLVAHRPKDFEAFLAETLKPEANPESEAGDVVDQEVLSWVLRHRSQLHALALKREVASIRGDDGRMTIPRGYVVTEITYLMDVTLQFAIELRLRDPRLIAWQRQHPDMTPVLHDALYFLSRHWLAGGNAIRTDTLGEAEFFDYLIKRMNLDELRSIVDGAGDAPLPLIEDDKILLFGVVKDLIKFLGPDGSIDDARISWASMSDGTASAKPEVPVPESVWNALRLGPESSPLEEVAGDEHAFKWRYWASGQAREERTLIEIAKTRVPRILATEARLREVLGTPVVESGGQKPAFALLAEELRILPTTPAWSRVAKAIDSIKAANVSTSAVVSDDDSRAVIDFAEMLKINDSLLVHMLAQGATLWALADQVTAVPDPEGHRRALRALSDGLQFSALDPAGMDRALHGLRTQIQQAFGKSLLAGMEAQPYVPSRVPGVAAMRIKNIVRDSFAQGRAAPNSVDAKRIATVALAWSELRGRLLDAARPEAYRAANYSEIFCALWQAGPSAVLRLDLREVTLAEWSMATLAALGFRGAPTPPLGPANASKMPLTSASTSGPVPRWLAYLALEQLGAGHLRPEIQTALFERLRAAPESSPPPPGGVKADLDALVNVQSSHPWRGAANQSRIVVFFLDRSVTWRRGWTARPTLGLVASLDIADAEAARQLLGNLHGATVLLAAEQPSAAPTPDQMESKMLPPAPPWNAPNIRPRWLWVGTHSMKEPRLVAPDPQGPDDLLAYVPVAS